METIVVSASEAKELLPMDECIDVMARALETLGRGAGINPLRSGMFLPEDIGLPGLMPSYLADPPASSAFL